MAISFVNVAAAASNTVAMPAQQVGDLLIVFAFNKSAATAPTIVAGWKGASNTGTTCAYTLGWKWATTTSEVTGTWTNATNVVVQIYRGVQRLVNGTFNFGTSTTLSYSAVTLAYTNSTSWGVRFAGHSAATNMATNLPSTTPNTERTATTSGAIGLDSNGGLSANITTGTQSVNTSGNWITLTAELVSGDTGVPTRDLYIGDYYVAATTNYVQKLSATGVQSQIPFTTFGRGIGPTIDTNGNVITPDSGNIVVYKMTPNGTQSTLSGFTSITTPFATVVDIAGNIYLADSGNNTVKKLTPGGVLSTLSFSSPALAGVRGIAVDTSFNVYVADATNKAVYKLTPAGVQSTLSFTGLQSPYGLTVGNDGSVYVVDNTNANVQKLTQPGNVQSTVGFTNISATAVGGPLGVAIDGSGTIYVSDFGYKCVYMLKNGVQTTLALTAVSPRIIQLQPYSTNDFFQILKRSPRQSLLQG